MQLHVPKLISVLSTGMSSYDNNSNKNINCILHKRNVGHICTYIHNQQIIARLNIKMNKLIIQCILYRN